MTLMCKALLQMTTSSRPPRRDPYAVCSRFGSVADAFFHNPRQGLWVPARRPGRREWIFRIHQITTSHTPPRSRDIARPSFANSSAPENERAQGDPQERAQGRPGARCTRGLMCQGTDSKAHTSIQVQRKQSGLPCAMVLTAYLRALPGETRACLSPSFPGSVSFPRT